MGSRAPLFRICSANSRLTPLMATTSYCFCPPLSPGFSLSIVNYDRWSPVGPSLHALVLNTFGESGSSAFGVGARRTCSCQTTSARTTSLLGRIEQFCRKRFLENSFSQTAELGEQLLGEQLLTNGSHELRRRT